MLEVILGNPGRDRREGARERGRNMHSVQKLSFSLLFFSLSPPSQAAENASCSPVKKITWLNTDANPLLVFSGGLPSDDSDDHNTVTVIQGTDHIALDFTSPVVDYFTIVGGCIYRVVPVPE